MNNRHKYVVIILMLQEIINAYAFHICLIASFMLRRASRKRKRISDPRPYTMIERFPTQKKTLNRMVFDSDIDCISNLRMDRNCFGRLCHLLKQLGGLEDRRYVSVEEQVSLFLGILAHDKKNREVSFNFWRSGETVSFYVHLVLKSILKLHDLLLKKPTPVEEDSLDPRWKWFKGFLGALDGTYVNIMVSNNVKPRYRTRKGQISTNTLAVFDRNLNFTYLLARWEGSAADGRILRDALQRPHGLKIPRASYYLCNNGYANAEGFLTPYKGVRYHLKEWGPEAVKPVNKEELYNLRHTRARNVIERAFGIMKMRWAIMRHNTFYPIKTQIRLIMVCFLIHNFIRSQMPNDPFEDLLDVEGRTEGGTMAEDDVDYVDCVDPTSAWSQKRDQLAQLMWEEYSGEVYD